MGAQFPEINITGLDLDLELPNDHPRREDLLPDRRPADGSSPSIIAWKNEPEESQPWNSLGASGADN
jgi:hypothetical protein